jgi:phosphatidylglycerophosphate synthase
MLDGLPGRLARRVPWTLSILRLVLGPAYVLSLEMSATLPLVIALLAAASDFVDGRLARRLGVASPAGAVLDVVGDGVFVLAALAALAAGARLSWLLPVAVALALAGLALATWRRRAAPAGAGGARPARGPADRAGHAAGIANYAVVIAASVAVAGWVGADWLLPVSVAVAVLNLAPLALRLAHGR